MKSKEFTPYLTQVQVINETNEFLRSKRLIEGGMFPLVDFVQSIPQRFTCKEFVGHDVEHIEVGNVVFLTKDFLINQGRFAPTICA